MRFCYRSHLVVAFTIASTCSAFAQPGPVGSVTIQVHNTFGSSVGNSLQQCTGCSYTPSPPTFVSNNTTSSPFTASAVSGGYNFTATTRYSALKSGQEYECQFHVPNLVGNNGSCAGMVPTPSATATNGVYPSPHCGYLIESQSSCNYTVTFTMAP